VPQFYHAPGPFAPFVAAFQNGLSEAGYVQGQNVTIEYGWAEGRFDRLPALAVDLVGRKVDVIVAGGPQAALAAKDATSTIPIVFHSGADPVASGLVASLARPGGNLTGVSFLTVELDAKRLELLSQLVPRAKSIALLVTNVPDNQTAIRIVQDGARAKGVRLQIVTAGAVGELETAFASLAPLQVGGLVVPTDAFFNSHREQLVGLAERHAVPAIYSFRDFAASGGLLSYGASLAAVYRQDGMFVGKILRAQNRPIFRSSSRQSSSW